MEKIWLKSYPPDVPSEINPDRYQSIVELFEESCGKFDTAPAFYNLGITLSFKELNDLSRTFAAYLQQKLQLPKGARVAIMLPNVLQYPIALFGILRAGLVVVNVNPLYTVPEVVHQLSDSGAETIIVLENFAPVVEKALPLTPLKQVIVARIEDFFVPWKAIAARFILKYIGKKIPAWSIPQAMFFKNILSEGKKLILAPVALTNQDLAFLQYTGGTTGLSKGAMLTHRNMIANIEQAYAWFGPELKVGQEVVLSALPLYHIFSLLVNCLLFATKVGGVNVLITNPRDVPKMIAEMSRFKFTCITGVNTLFNALLKNPRFAFLDFKNLRLTVAGGMALQRTVAEQWQALTGSVLLEGYGLTEASPCVAVNPYGLASYSGAIGFPLPSTEVAILNDQGEELPLGQPGELAVRGPQVMTGYWQQPAETRKIFNTQGWLLTGDIATLDEQGRLRILERKKDMILVSGFNVYPNEVEDILAAIPGVLEAAVVGVPDENSGEAVKAFIVRENKALTAAEIIRRCHESLTPYKVPKSVEFCKELPKTNVGKILRRQLREADKKPLYIASS
jgi:long-chain acyl-CoA synthetase